jgi:hypothetical protein
VRYRMRVWAHEADHSCLDSLPMLDSLGAPTERCLSKIAHWNDRASRGVESTPGEGDFDDDMEELALAFRITAAFMLPSTPVGTKGF